MNEQDPKLTVLQFNEAINRRDIEALSALMSDDHTFIDSEGTVHSGKTAMVEGWMDFFKSYPDHRNRFLTVESRYNLVLVTGYSTCSYEPLDGPALWTATVEDDLVTEWRVYLDTSENRERLDLPING